MGETCSRVSSTVCSGGISWLLLVAWLLVGCGGEPRIYVDNKAPSDPGEPHYGGRITVGLIGETNSWLPGRSNIAAAGVNVLVSLFDPLFLRDHKFELRPYLAESVEPGPDYLYWDVSLRPGVRFHDGTAFDAVALKWNFDELHKRPGSVTFGQVRDVTHVEVVDDLTLRYHLVHRNVAFPDILTSLVGVPYSPSSFEKHGDDAGSNPVGTGPFRFVEWRRDDRMVVERNPDYWQMGLPYLDGITFRPLPDEDTRLASLISRDIDVLQTARQPIVDRIRQTEGIYRHEFIGNSGGGSIINTERPPVDDRRVRLALGYALPQEAVIEVLGAAGITPAQKQFFNPPSPWFSEYAASRYPEGDLEKARDLLQDYQHDPQRSDGMEPGDPVTVEFLCLPDPSLMELAQIYQAFWNAAGFQVRLRQVEQATQVQRATQGDYMITCWRAGSEADPYTVLSNAFGPPDQQLLNFTNFQHPEIEGLLNTLREEADFDLRYAAVERFMLLLTEEMPYIWTAATPAALASDPRVRNIGTWRFPDGTPGDGIPQARTLWGQVWLVPES